MWGDWGEEEHCNDGGFATEFRSQWEDKQYSDDDTALNSICLVCNTGGQICSNIGEFGQWYQSWPSDEGFNGADFAIEPNEGGWSDDTAANKLWLYYNGHEFGSGHDNYWGVKQGKQSCGEDQLICGLQTRVESFQGGGDTGGDDTEFNGIKLICCDPM